MKNYYAADNRYGNETSVGFANTWYVIAFPSKDKRDAFVKKSWRVSTRAIRASEVRRYGNVQYRMNEDGHLEEL